MSDKASIVIPVYNCEKYIIWSIASCLDQSYDDFEVIVIDDKSTDNTLDVIKKFQKQLMPKNQKRLTVLERERNGHTGAALNTGIKAMTGEWFKEMQADDFLFSNCLADMIPAAKQHGQLDNTIFYADVEWINSEGKKLAYFPENNRNHLTAFEFNTILLQHNIGNGISVLLHRSALEKHGLFDEVTKHEDYEMRLRWCINQGARMHFIPCMVGQYRIHDGRYSNRPMKSFIEEDLKIKDATIKKLDPQTQQRYAQAMLEKNYPPYLYPGLGEQKIDLATIIRMPHCIY